MVSIDQTTMFLAGVGLVGPSSMSQIRKVAYACFGPSIERHCEFDALFRAHFEGDAVMVSTPDDESSIEDNDESLNSPLATSVSDESGEAASDNDVFSKREFVQCDVVDLHYLLRDAKKHLPTRRGFRLRPKRRGRAFDIKRSIAQIVRFDGDIPRPALRKRHYRQRPLLLLIDISGSMKQYTDDYLRLAHYLLQADMQIEVFTLGTKLTQITQALAYHDEGIALTKAAELVLDWDGGTLLGQAMSSFIQEPRYMSLSRGAAVMVLSDGLECDNPAVLVNAVKRISHTAWRLSWATPLAGDPRFQPRTAALKAMLPLLDDLVDGSSLRVLAEFILSLGKNKLTALQIWKQEK